MKKILLLISLFVLGNTYGQIKTFKGNTFTSSQCVAGGLSTVYYPKGTTNVPSNLLSKHAGESPDSNFKMTLVVDDPAELWIAAEIVFLTTMPNASTPMADMLSISSSDYTLTAYANRTREEDKTLNCNTSQVSANQNNKIRFNLEYNGTSANGTPTDTFDITVTDPTSNVTETINVTVNNTLSVDELDKYDFSFGPNPTANFIYLSASKNIGNVEIFNLVGQKTLSTNLRESKGTLDISNLSKGVYIMNVAIDKNIGTYKLIKQ